MAEKVYFSLGDDSIAYFYLKKRPLLLKKAAYFFPHPVKDDKSEPERGSASMACEVPCWGDLKELCYGSSDAEINLVC